jgi:hypothetical protein
VHRVATNEPSIVAEPSDIESDTESKAAKYEPKTLASLLITTYLTTYAGVVPGEWRSRNQPQRT